VLKHMTYVWGSENATRRRHYQFWLASFKAFPSRRKPASFNLPDGRGLFVRAEHCQAAGLLLAERPRWLDKGCLAGIPR
jgi:hypothetical protein